MQRTVVSTPAAAAPAAFYSQGVKVGDLVFTAGCVGVDPATARVAEGFGQQVRTAIANVDAILRSAGSSLDRVVKTTCYLVRQESFEEFDAIYRELFTGEPPARTTVVCDLVRSAFLFEIEAVAVV